ncbi:MAG: hypothetical protein QME42_03195 [bacterium]|nr:hypothetical protein [bacterium]
MPVITKRVQLSVEEVFRAIEQLTPMEKGIFLSLCEEKVDVNSEHNLPKGFVNDIKMALKEVEKGNYSNWED